jgi:hypothetical protein
MFVPHRKHITFPIRAQQVNAICMFVTIVTILDSIHRLVFYLKPVMDNVPTSQETYYVSATSHQVCDNGMLT